MNIAVARIAEDLSIFQILTESSEQPLDVATLATKTGAAPVLLGKLSFSRTYILSDLEILGRILRYLSSVGLIRETGPHTFTANAQTKTLAQPGYRGAIYNYFDNRGPIMQALPDFLAETNYQDINDSTRTPFNKAFSTDLPLFAWLQTQPKRLDYAQQLMSVKDIGAVPWFSVFHFEEELGSFAGPDVFVDIGGGFGQQCKRLIDAFPQVKGRVVLQDLSQTLVQLPSQLEGVKTMTHDFFEPQPVKGAKFYYFRNIMHDWPDVKCVAILKQIVQALGSDSQVLIDEMALPEVGVPWEATTLDIGMMASLGARQRTVEEWHTLLDAAGLHVLRIDTYLPDTFESIIQAVAK